MLLVQFNWTNASSSTRGLSGSHDDAHMSTTTDDYDMIDNTVESSTGKWCDLVTSIVLTYPQWMIIVIKDQATYNGLL